MTSSTSPSEPASRFPAILLLALAAMLAAWSVAALYTLKWNPEVKLFKHGALVKEKWSGWLGTVRTNKVVLCGGSSSSFSVDGARALRLAEVPVSNMALGAGMGPKVLTRLAASQAKQGDTLLLMMEPELLEKDTEPTQLGIQMSVALGRPELAGDGDEIEPRSGLSWKQRATALRPGGYHFFTLIGKAIRRVPLYRYQPTDFDESGQQHTQARIEPTNSLEPYHLSPPAKHWLALLREWGGKKRVELVYDMPWAYCPSAGLRQCRRQNAAFLLEVMEFMPVLADERLGVFDDASSYADTFLHMTTEGSAFRTDQLTRNLKSRRFWTREELLALAHE